MFDSKTLSAIPVLEPAGRAVDRELAGRYGLNPKTVAKWRRAVWSATLA
jgi:hypothetical protein